jgi:hypothetical protein
LIGGFSGRVCTNNWGNSEEKWKHNYLEGLELIKSNTTLAFLFNTGLSSSSSLSFSQAKFGRWLLLERSVLKRKAKVVLLLMSSSPSR